MTYERLGPAGLDYCPCRYGGSRVLFRGPQADLRQPHVMFLGGTATYGKFVPRPFPALIEAETGLHCANLGAVNAGPDLYLNDPALLDLTQGAMATVIQVMGVPNMSNRYYSVHPRRNDRVLQASNLLKTDYREVDFTAFHFTRHMLATLQALSEERFAVLMADLRTAWLDRMTRLIAAVGSPVILLWMADRGVGQRAGAEVPVAEQADPLFVDRAMMARLQGQVAAVVEVVEDPGMRRRADGMVYSRMEAAAAKSQLGIPTQVSAARALVPVLRQVLADRPVLLN